MNYCATCPTSTRTPSDDTPKAALQIDEIFGVTSELVSQDLDRVWLTTGKYAAFHSNRSCFITNLAKAGVLPKTAQMLARHSDGRLTMNVYTHSDFQEQAEAVARLPNLWE